MNDFKGQIVYPNGNQIGLLMLNYILETKKEMLEKIENKLLTKCNHEWIIDYIDVEIEKNDTIKYCKHCELTYSTNSFTT